MAALLRRGFAVENMPRLWYDTRVLRPLIRLTATRFQ